MMLPDVNVLLYAHREESPDHALYREWLEALLNGAAAFGISELVLSGVVRIATDRRIYSPPSAVERALAFADEVRSAPGCVLITPGPRHWDIFTGLCRSAGVRGPDVSDAYFAALAIESGSEWITTDTDFVRFPGLRWRHPLA